MNGFTCPNCGIWCFSYQWHQCLNTGTIQPTYVPYIPYVPSQIKGQKCDMCGSTAIDHTEIQCSLNRTLKKKGYSK